MDKVQNPKDSWLYQAMTGGLLPGLTRAKKLKLKKPIVPAPKGNINWENLKNFPDGTSLDFMDPITITKGSSKRSQIQELFNLGSYVRSLIQSYMDKTEQLVIDSYQRTLILSSSNPFKVIIFITIQENGETITTTQGTNENLLNDLWTAIGTENQNMKVKIAKLATYSEGAWRTTLNLNLTREANFLVKDYIKKSLHEITPGFLEGNVGIIIQGRSSEETIVNGVQSTRICFHTMAKTRSTIKF